jgi:hypothetical protein
MNDSLFTVTVGEKEGKTTIVLATSKMNDGDIRKIAIALIEAIEKVYESLDRDADVIVLGHISQPSKKGRNAKPKGGTPPTGPSAPANA